MACLIKAPSAGNKGCVSFTTPERDNLIKQDPALRASIEQLKSRYYVGLHHNWHDTEFLYDPLFDFSMAGDGDLTERTGRDFPRIALDACNFAPSSFAENAGTEKFWDVLCTSRAVFFKGLPEFFQAIRKIYDRGRMIRVLHLCPVPPKNAEGTHLHDIRQKFEALFSPAERRYFNLMTMEWDNPFPLDLETLAFFYRASRIYVHSAPQERRARAAAYAWASGMPVVCRANVASILPPELHRRPFWYEFDEPAEMADAMIAAIDQPKADTMWQQVTNEFSIEGSVARLETWLQTFAAGRGETLATVPINGHGLDIRLGRHNGIGGGTNQVDSPLDAFCHLLKTLPDEKLAGVARAGDPELFLAEIAAREIVPSDQARPRPAASDPSSWMNPKSLWYGRWLKRRSS